MTIDRPMSTPVVACAAATESTAMYSKPSAGHPPLPQRLLTLDEVADLIQVHPNTVVNLTKRGVLRRAKLEGCTAVRYTAAEVSRYMNELQTRSAK